MKRLIFALFLIITSCATTQTVPSVKKHSYDTREGKQKLKKYNDLQYGADRQFDYRVKRTEKAYKKAGYKDKKTKKKK